MAFLMYVVAITRWGAGLEEELQPLAELLGLTAYDARLRLRGPLPVILVHTSDAQEAKRLRSWPMSGAKRDP